MTTRPKQANNRILKFENYLLARMQCKGQGYMMLKDTTCKTKRYYIKTYLALANVPMWHYGFKPSPNSTIHYPPFLEPLPLVNYYDQAFGPIN